MKRERERARSLDRLALLPSLPLVLTTFFLSAFKNSPLFLLPTLSPKLTSQWLSPSVPLACPRYVARGRRGGQGRAPRGAAAGGRGGDEGE